MRTELKKTIRNHFKFSALLLFLTVSPALAVLDVNLVLVDSDTIAICYTGADSQNLPRAFALDLTITGGIFDSVDNYLIGESNAPNHRGYGIFPAAIYINTSNIVDDYGTPEAEAGDPGTSGTGLTTDRIILEFSSLYYGEANAPATSGTLCTLNFTAGTAAYITMVDEDTYRGGLVFEDGSLGDVDDTLILTLPLPLPATNPYPANETVGVNPATTTAISWTAGAYATSHAVYFGTVNPPPFIGNQAGTSYTVALVQGKIYYCRVVEENSFGSSAALNWSFNTDCLIGGNAGVGEYLKWVNYGKPSCWCCKKQCRGDADCKMTLTKPVMSPDLTVFKECYNKASSIVLTTVVNGTPCICADFDHKDTLTKPIMSLDLTIFKGYYNKPETSIPPCDQAPIITGPYNFWTN